VAEYIEREALLGRMNNFCEINCDYTKKQRSVMCGACGIGDAKIMVEDAIAADVRPVVHGEWKENVQCSNCGWYMEDDVTLSSMMVFFNFCPNCGADMREAE